MVERIGFDSRPLCIIVWESNGEAKSKTVCYTEDDKKWAIDRFNTHGDFYNESYDKAVINYVDRTIENTKLLQKVGA